MLQEASNGPWPSTRKSDASVGEGTRTRGGVRGGFTGVPLLQLGAGGGVVVMSERGERGGGGDGGGKPLLLSPCICTGPPRSANGVLWRKCTSMSAKWPTKGHDSTMLPRGVAIT